MIIAKPISLDQEDNSHGDINGSSFFKVVLTLLKDFRPGSDLTTLQVPPQLNMPKSVLQFYGEQIYAFKENMLRTCNIGANPIERLIGVIGWALSNRRPWLFSHGSSYVPILGETHHVSHGSLNVLLEEVSHHPLVIGVHATDEKENIEYITSQHPVPKYYGTSVELNFFGKRQLKLLNYGETYVMNFPKTLIKLFPVPKIDFGGTEKIQCHETGLEAELSYGGRSFFSIRRSSKLVKGMIFASSDSPSKPLFEINGHWDEVVTLKDLKNGETRVIYDAKEVISGLHTPIIKDLKEISSSESVSVWKELTEGIFEKDWKKAGEAKRSVEKRQRELARERKLKGEIWVPRHFSTYYSIEEGWSVSPLQNLVPAAPIIVPTND